MTRRWALLVAAALVVLAVSTLAYRWLSSKEPAAGSTRSSGAGWSDDDRRVAAIYFPSTSGLLEPEMREAPTDLDAASYRLWLAEQLAAGPQTEGLRAPLPPETSVATVYSAPGGTVFVDFAVSETAVGMGSTEELLALYSVVNTLLLDDDSARNVVILINGRQRETLAGHVDTTRPLEPRLDLVRDAG